MSIDERLEKLTERHESLTHTVEILAQDLKDARERTERLDRRERQARKALLTGIIAYMNALEQDDQGQ